MAKSTQSSEISRLEETLTEVKRELAKKQRALEIEAALERVRAKVMGMSNSNELNEISFIFGDQLRQLGIDWVFSYFWLIEEEKGSNTFWITWPDKKSSVTAYPMDDPGPLLTECLASWRRGDQIHSNHLPPGHIGDFLDSFEQLIVDAGSSAEQIMRRENFPHGLYYYDAMMRYGSFGLCMNNAATEEANQIQCRFAIEFERAYMRFLELQKAETQAREAQIEAALERVRSRTMAMQKSAELQEVIQVVYEQFVLLNIRIDHCGFVMDYKTRDDYHIWIADRVASPSQITIPYFNCVYYNQFNEAKAKGLDFFATNLSFEEKNTFYQDLFKHVPGLPEEALEFLLTCPGLALSTVLLDDVCLYIENFSGIPYTDEDNHTLVRFGNVFQQTYTRFHDLQKAEAQVRESQIEAALEKVRSSTMAMHKSDELLRVITIIAEQLQQLKFRFGNVSFAVRNQDHDYKFWFSGPGLSAPYHIHVPYINNPMFERVRHFQKEDLSIYTDILSIEESRHWHQHVFEHSELRSLPAEVKDHILNCGYARTIVFMPTIMLIVGNYASQPYTEEENNIFKRFAGVFEQSYTRFLDLQKAEAQAREAQIEAALERVRSKAMAMHKSEDLNPAVATVFEELEKLSRGISRCGIGILDREKRMANAWITSLDDEGTTVQISGDEPIDAHPLLQGAFEAWLKQEDFSYVLKGKDMTSYYETSGTGNVRLPDSQLILADDLSKQQYYHFSVFQEGGLFAFRDTAFPEEVKAVMKRFAGVFNLTYQRFLDIQRAEAQTREAQIEASLERVRAHAMAMHNSADLSSTVNIFFRELKTLGITPMRCGVGEMLENTHTSELVFTTADKQGELYELPGKLLHEGHPVVENIYNYWKRQEEYHPILQGADIIEYYKVIKSQMILPEFPEYTRHFGNYFYFKEGFFFAWAEKAFSEEAMNIFRKFTSVLSLTYKRYKDLKLAEAQAREATIEAALEKVRGKAMAMNDTKDLSSTILLAFSELNKLGIRPLRFGVGLINKEQRKGQLYSATSSEDGVSLALMGWILFEGHPVFEQIFDSWVKGEDYFPILEGQQLKSYYELLAAGLSVPKLPDWKGGEKQYGHFFPLPVSCLYAWADQPYLEPDIRILKRFASIVELTFKRYLELQKSEANARDAIRQASLDRVRAEIASMRTTADLERITPLIWNELTTLGVPFIRCGVFIMDDAQQQIRTFLSTPDGDAIAAFLLPYETPGPTAHVLAHWRRKEMYRDHWDAAAFKAWTKILTEQGAIAASEKYLTESHPANLHLHFLPFLQGMLYTGSETPLSAEELYSVQNLADAFSAAYARYEDFNRLETAKGQIEKTLVDLKQAQAQLVQSEKMASLGELTAGIAHEIQNPLNFVNNFSEVSNELIEEMNAELDKGDVTEAKAIASDIRRNLEKINHHGKRADAIVKGMLQHSRTSSGTKEPTDINMLADEYLRLAYYGLRAKDKSFNASMKTNFDETIRHINIIPQDIGRVILNLITNAFYAVTEKAKGELHSQTFSGRRRQIANGDLESSANREPRSTNGDWHPTVTVTTKTLGDKIEIRVKDNGNGIPEHIKDKIFQPFFTTKPTGQGTGLGLSLSYDIVKAHGGILKVQTQEGVGSEFIIHLPNN